MIGDRFPYTSLYVLNLDILYDMVKEMQSEGRDVAEELAKILNGTTAVPRAQQAESAQYAGDPIANSTLATAVSNAENAYIGVSAFVDGSAIVKKAELSANGSNLDIVAQKADSALSNTTGIIYGNITVAKATRASSDMDGNVFPNTYVKKTDIATGSSAGVVMANSLNGIDVDYAGQIQIHTPNNTNIDNRNTDENFYKRTAVTLKTLDYAVKKSITANANTLSAAEKTAVQNWIGVNASGGGTATSLYSEETDQTGHICNIPANTGEIYLTTLADSSTVTLDATGIKITSSNGGNRLVITFDEVTLQGYIGSSWTTIGSKTWASIIGVTP